MCECTREQPAYERNSKRLFSTASSVYLNLEKYSQNRDGLFLYIDNHNDNNCNGNVFCFLCQRKLG